MVLKQMEVEKEPSFKKHMPLEPRLNRICVLEDLDFYWDASELKLIKKMWKMELSINYMAEYFDRDPDEVILAVIHLAREDKVYRRKVGLLG